MRQVGYFLQWSNQENGTGSRNNEKPDLRDIFKVARLGNKVLSMSEVKQ